MADIKRLVPFIKKWEGGFVHDPDDLGGATNKGVTIGTFKNYRKRKGLPEPTVDDLMNISESEWMDILKTFYWDKWQADEIKNQAVANILVDWVWASGSYGIKIPQYMLGVNADGIVGPKTLNALNAYPDQAELYEKIYEERLAFVDRICTSRPRNKKFRKGWINRINDIKNI